MSTPHVPQSRKARAAVSDQQLLDGIDQEEFKRYMHQYNFPSYSVGETKPSRGPAVWFNLAYFNGDGGILILHIVL